MSASSATGRRYYVFRAGRAGCVSVSSATDRSYVLLMRHGRDLEGAGFDEVRAVGRRLAETLDGLKATEDPWDEIRLGRVLQAPSRQAAQTAAALDLPAEVKREQEPKLHPMRASTYSGDRLDDELDQAVAAVSTALKAAREDGHNAVLVLGHQPTMSRIAARLSRRSVVLAHAEIACLQGERIDLPKRTWRLHWTIAPSDPDTDAALRAKVASKMQVAGVLGAVVTAALVFLLQDLFDVHGPKGDMPIVLRYVSALSLFLSTSLYLTTLFFYDWLMMPPRFWDEGSPARRPWWLALLGRIKRPAWLVEWRMRRERSTRLVRRPPSSATWVVYQNMTRIWSWFFNFACGFLLIGVLLLGISLFEPQDAPHFLWLSAAFLGGCVLLAAFVWVGRPRLSVED